MNIANTIIPKSDQLNADDLITGVQTITITDVTKGSAEQPVVIHYEGENGRPYKPGKSMRRVLVAMWGPEAKVYIGRSLTLFRDPDIRFGGEAVGGIRISHATDIEKPFEIALTVTRGKRKTFTVEPLVVESLAEIEAAGLSMAQQGKEAFNSWWTGLSADTKSKLKPKLAEWKPIVEAASPKTE